MLALTQSVDMFGVM